MYKRHVIGKKGEDEATNYLKQNGYKIIERNFYCRQGEIDIITMDKKTNEYVFVEVKTRTSLLHGKPIEAVDQYKQKHIVYATKYYIYKNHLENQYIRFDIITIYKNNLYHYKNCDFKVKRV